MSLNRKLIFCRHPQNEEEKITEISKLLSRCNSNLEFNFCQVRIYVCKYSR